MSDGPFWRLLGGQATRLYYDMLDRPHAYRPEELQVVERLVGGSTAYQDLTDEERQLLDGCTVEALQRRTPAPMKVEAPKPVPKTKATKPAVKEVPRPKEPESGMPAFWWI